MLPVTDRRSFLKAASAGAAVALAPRLFAADDKKAVPFKISLAQWSLHKAFFGKKLDPLKFAEIAKKEYDIAGVEYVNQFYKDKKKDDAYLKDVKKVADDNGVTSVLIMCDGEGNLGDPDEAKRQKAVDNHVRWLEWAKFLGCHSIRVNAASDWKKGFDETQKLAADGLRKLCEQGDKHGLNVIVENHGGLSSHGEWLAGVMKKIDHKRAGTLPDFGNFNIGKIDTYGPSYDRYKGVDELMPFAKGASAKTYDLNEKG
ncbi:MAG: sugar phosphate isomerase/epimerase family protein, partial [Gemmataceae bacterium]